MIGFIFLLLSTRQIYIIIKNGLTSRQIKKASSGQGSLVLIMIKNSDFIDLDFLQQLALIRSPHQPTLIIPMDHPQILQLAEQSIAVVSYDSSTQSAVTMINQLCGKSELESIFVCDFNIVFENDGLFGLEKILVENNGPFCIIPQVHSNNMTIDCLYTLNPNLALISLFSFKRLTRALRRPLLEVSELGLAFRKTDFKDFPENQEWKSSLFHGFHTRALGIKLCFGEKFFSVYLASDLKALWQKMGKIWQKAEEAKDYSLPSLLVMCLIWAFPILFFESHPFYAIAIIFLLLIYRLFTLIIFQENILSIVIHPISSVLWLARFVVNKGHQIKNLLSK